MPRIRFSIRWPMIAVAIVAVGLGLAERSWRFRRVASYHSARSITVFIFDGFVTSKRPPGGLDSYGDPVTQDRSEWHKAMAAKYERASRYPWLPVPPDPPMPPQAPPEPD